VCSIATGSDGIGRGEVIAPLGLRNMMEATGVRSGHCNWMCIPATR
jgi:hypothetical protein